ncbi:hypothetical protein D6D17_08769 [Aureobasidium pullulans]|nr:hypothetical protein D6D17_08769 [Aureobasidium pullulans]
MAPTNKQCAVCSEPGKLCGSCENIHYCGPVCQKADWKVHKLLCRSFKAARDPPGPDMMRVIAFPFHNAKPEFLWMPIRPGKFQRPIVGTYFDSNINLATDTHSFAIEPSTGKKLPLRVAIQTRDTASSDGSLLNRAIYHLTGGSTYQQFAGPVLAYGRGIESEKDKHVNLDTTHLNVIKDWFTIGFHVNKNEKAYLERYDEETEMFGAGIKEKGKDDFEKELQANTEEAVRANQAGHSLSIEDSMYGRMSRESPWITMREKDAFRKVSIDWHRIVGFQPVQTEGRNTAKSLAHMEQQAEADKFQRWRAFRQADMLDAFKRMMGPDAEFRGVQFAILQALMQGHKNVLGIMPTGGGKSLTFMLPARCSPGGVTIVVIPLTALEGDMVRRCKESDIKCAVWDAARPPEWASIVFVTPEATVGQAFKRFMQQKKSTGELDRLVIDECHVVLDSRRKTAEKDAWRPEILELYKTVEQSVQTLFLTATLPPRNELEFYDRMGINKHEIVKFRDSTTRKEIKYQVVDYEKEEEEEALQRMVDDKKRQYPGKQIVVYCSKIQDGQRYAKTLGCHYPFRFLGACRKESQHDPSLILIWTHSHSARININDVDV